MSQHKFIDRKEEIEILERSYSKGEGGLFIIYGRRRVGKTELISRFITGRGIYFMATNEGDRENIRDFQRIISEFIGDSSLRSGQFQDWYSLFSMIAGNSSFQKKCSEFKFIIAIDEFPYLIEANRSIPSIFQKVYDSLLRHMNIMLILSGSSISIMENEVLSYKSPLYGRRTGQLRLSPLNFRYIKEFLNYKMTDLCRTYFVIGGIPEYLLRFESDLTFHENIYRNILSRGAPLYEEGEFLLRTEMREPRNYTLILRSIAHGNHTLGEICSYTGLDKSMVSKYIDVLMSLELIEPEVPFGASDKFKRRLYWISDPYLSFWFRFVLPNKSEIEGSHMRELNKEFLNNFEVYAGEQFERLMKKLVADGIMGRTFDNVARWWGRNGSKRSGEDIEEIDIVAYSEGRNELLFAECKWTSKPVSVTIVNRLKLKSKQLLEQYPESKVTYAVFSKSRFTGDIKEVKKEAVLMDLDDMEKILFQNAEKSK
ncbi:MAG: ATP-binding protein [Candidatus Thermoplasmatota archaeon]|nr:ATP-binding protein [Candidatus Thermoplasmatota archaeon]